MIHARYVAALTEFWRCHRNAAGVLHFCGLGYSRAGDQPRPKGGATSDDWIDLEQLTFEPTFEKYVRDAFSPVGLMLDFWAETVPAGTEQNVKVYVINDLEPEWKGELRLLLLKGTDCVSTRTANSQVPGFGREIVTIPQTMPSSPGDYTLVAELADSQGNAVRSLRDFKVVAPGECGKQSRPRRGTPPGLEGGSISMSRRIGPWFVVENPARLGENRTP